MELHFTLWQKFYQSLIKSNIKSFFILDWFQGHEISDWNVTVILKLDQGTPNGQYGHGFRSPKTLWGSLQLTIPIVDTESNSLGWKRNWSSRIKTMMPFYLRTVCSTTSGCKDGRSTIITLRCDPNAKGNGTMEFIPECRDGTCDGCRFLILWTTEHACPACGEHDYTAIKGECKAESQEIHYVWKEHRFEIFGVSYIWLTFTVYQSCLYVVDTVVNLFVNVCNKNVRQNVCNILQREPCLWRYQSISERYCVCMFMCVWERGCVWGELKLICVVRVWQ